MAENLLLELQPDGKDLRIVLHGGNLLAGVVADMPRAAPALDRAKLDALRGGTATQPETLGVADAVSNWLLGTDFRAHLQNAMAKGIPFRIVVCPNGRLVEALSDVPFELVHDGAGPLALEPGVEAIVHVLRRTAPARPAPGAREWPLRILVVRSNPTDLGGLVPEAAPIRDRILQFAPPLVGAVRVDVLSSEPAIGRPPTWKAVRDELASGPTGYDILVYLGHGDVIPGFQGVPPCGVLKLEDDAGESRDVRADQLRTALVQAPVPVVILAGCLTGHAGPLQGQIANFMRASQGVAQALVSSDSGVKLAVGMRYRLDTTDAQLFLEAFFESLLVDHRGDVEAAVRAGRAELYGHNPFPPSWSAPVVYRGPGEEPTFEFLRKEPLVVEPGEDAQQQYRELAWKHLATLSRGARTPDVARGMYDIAEAAEKWIRDRIHQRGIPLVAPRRVEVVPGETAKVVVELDGALSVKRLQGRILFSDPTAVASDAKPAAGLKPTFQALFGTTDPGEITFHLDAKGAAAAALPQGPLFEFSLPAGPTAGVFHTLSFDDLAADPFHTIRGLKEAVIVTPP